MIHFFLKSFILLALFLAFTIFVTRNPIYSLISLVATFLCSGIFLIMLSQDFMGITLIIVYVGAITVLLLFVIMTLNIRRYESYTPIYRDWFRFVTLLAFVGFVYSGVTKIYAASTSSTMTKHFFYSFFLDHQEFPQGLYYLCVDSMGSVGRFMYTEFSVLFILAALILLISMIGALLIAQGDKTNFKKQSTFDQTMRDPKKCLTLHSNKKSETKKGG